MLLENKKVAIIGGGPGGLTLARLLQLKGVYVTVYERDFNQYVRVQGATLDLHYGSGLKAIEAAGLMDEFKKTYRPGADKGRVVDKHGNILFDEHNGVNDTDFTSEDARPEIDRADLRNLLLDSLNANTVVWDSHLIALHPVGDAWQLEFKNGTKPVADLVIGADGANSKIRPWVTPVKPFYAGTVILQGNIENSETTAPEMHKLLKGGKIYNHTSGKYLHVSAKGDGSIDVYISCLAEEGWVQNSGIDFNDRAQLLAWFKKEFPGWVNVWLELIEHVNLPLLIRPQYCMPLNQTWDTQSNITLLGDAAHIMPPSGEGVNLAMQDALELSENLTSTGFDNVQAAIAAYEKPMMERAMIEAEVSLDTVAWMHTEEGMDQLIELFSGK